MPRPVLYVLAGVNGAGKSSIGGYLLARQGLAWFNHDTFARELNATTGCDQESANAHAWHEGLRRLDEAVERGLSYAFETTLSGTTVTAKLLTATRTHEVLIWFVGLASPELHIDRVRARVAAGGHAIAEEKIREGYPQAQLNLIKLLPHVAYATAWDNSTSADRDGAVPDPLRVLAVDQGRLIWPAADDVQALRRTPQWAHALVEAALRAGGGPHP